MKAVIQRVRWAKVLVDQNIVGSIEQGYLVYLGIEAGDDSKDEEYLLQKIINLRLFANDKGAFDRSLLDIDGALLIVSQFTLMADCRKGRRPSFSKAAPPEQARDLFNQFVEKAKTSGVKQVATGQFQADMKVESCNDGPVTILLDSNDR